MTTFDLDDYIVEALRAGASGFLLKDATPAELVRRGPGRRGRRRVALTQDHQDGCWTCTRTSCRPPDGRRRCAHAGHQARGDGAAAWWRTGDSNAEIGRSLHLAESSVKSHVGHLLAKLGLTDRVHLVIFAYDNGLVWQSAADNGLYRERPG